MTKPLTDLSATEAIAAMRQGDISAVDYATALLQRCEAGKHLNAFITLEPGRVLEAASAADKLRATGAQPGPLHGLPVPVIQRNTERQVGHARLATSTRKKTQCWWTS